MSKPDQITNLAACRAARRSGVAYHEAGHTLAARALGYRVAQVTIVQTTGSEGQVDWSTPIRRPSVRRALEGIGDVDRAQPFIEHHIIVALAGPIAQRRHKPRSRWRYGGSGATRGEFIAKGSDHQHALDLIARLYEGQQKIIDTYWRYLEARAEVIVDAHWTEISRLAGALLEHQTLKGEEILAVVLPPDLLDLRKDLKRQSHEDALRKGH